MSIVSPNVDVVELGGIERENLAALLGSQLGNHVHQVFETVWKQTGGMREVGLEHDVIRAKLPHGVDEVLLLEKGTGVDLTAEHLSRRSLVVKPGLDAHVVQGLEQIRNPTHATFDRDDLEVGEFLEKARSD